MKLVDQFEAKVKSTIKKHELIKGGDKLLVAYSGGKDSTSVLYLLNKLSYRVEALMINLLMGDYSKKHLANAEKFCNELSIKLHVINFLDETGKPVCSINPKLSNCLVCGVIKRWLLNKKARELGFNKLVTGHNLDDESETLMMNLFGGNPKLVLGCGPKNGLIEDEHFVQRIKPLYYCTNDEVRNYSQAVKLPVFDKPCPCSGNAFRSQVREQLSMIEEQLPSVKQDFVSNFLKLLPELKKAYSVKGELSHCVECGEPSRKSVCKHCELINTVG